LNVLNFLDDLNERRDATAIRIYFPYVRWTSAIRP